MKTVLTFSGFFILLCIAMSIMPKHSTVCVDESLYSCNRTGCKKKLYRNKPIKCYVKKEVGNDK